MRRERDETLGVNFNPPPLPPRHSFIDGYFAIRTTLETNYKRSQIAFYYCAKRDDEAGEGDKIGAVII